MLLSQLWDHLISFNFIQLPASEQALRGRWARRRSRWKPSHHNPTFEGLLAGYLITVDSLLTVTLFSIWHYGKMPKITLRNIVESHLQWVLRSAYKVKCQQSGVYLTIPAATHWHALPWLRTRGKLNIQRKILKLQCTIKRATMKTCNLFCNIAAKRFEKRCCEFHYLTSNLSSNKSGGCKLRQYWHLIVLNGPQVRVDGKVKDGNWK